MALRAQSLFLYGFQVTLANQSIDFKTASNGAILQATLNVGYYSLTTLLVEVVRAMGVADPANMYTATTNRTINGGLENRNTISTGGGYLSVLFTTGPRAVTSAATLLGFSGADLTGATSYTGTVTSGTKLLTQNIGYSFRTPALEKKNFGIKNLSSSGNQEVVIFSTQSYWHVQFKYILGMLPSDDVFLNWVPMLLWMSQGKLVEFTPEITAPTVFYEGWLESSAGDSKGLGYHLTEMLPNFPFYWDTGQLKFRVRPTS